MGRGSVFEGPDTPSIPTTTYPFGVLSEMALGVANIPHTFLLSTKYPLLGVRLSKLSSH